MGNLCAAGHGLVRSEVECRRQGTNSKKRNDKNIAKVLLVDGRVLRFKEPIKAAEVVLAISMGHDYPSHAHPPHVQYSSTNFIICPLKPGLQSLSILAPHQHLQLGHLYLLLPSNLILRSTSPDPPPPPTNAAATSTGVNNIITPQLPLQLHYDSAAALDHYPSPHPKMLQRSHHRRSKSAVISGPTAAQVVDFVGASPDAAAAAAQIGGAAHSPSLHTSTSPLGSTAAAAAASPPTAAYSDVQLRMRSKSDVGCSGSVSRAAILKNAATSIKSRGSSYNQDTNYNNHDINMSKSAAAAAAFDNFAKQQQQQQLVMGSTAAAAAAAAQEALYRRHGGSSSYNYNSAQMKKSSSRRKSPSDRSSSSTISSCSGSSRTRAQSIDLGRINGTNHLLLQERALQMNGRSRSSRWATATAANRGVDKVVDAGGVISMGRYGYGHSENGGGNKQAIGGRGADKGAEEKHGSMYRSSRSSSGGSGGGSHGIINSGSPSNFDYSIPAALRRCRSWAPRLQTIEENPASFAYHH